MKTANSQNLAIREGNSMVLSGSQGHGKVGEGGCLVLLLLFLSEWKISEHSYRMEPVKSETASWNGTGSRSVAKGLTLNRKTDTSSVDIGRERMKSCRYRRLQQQ